MSLRKYNLPEVQTKTGVIQTVDYGTDTCSVIIDNVLYDKVKVHYHCDENMEDKGGSTAFKEKDYVTILCDKNGFPLEVFGFVGKRKPCSHEYLIMLPKEQDIGYYEYCYGTESAGGIYYIDVWNTKKGKVCDSNQAIQRILVNSETLYNDTGEKLSITGLPVNSDLDTLSRTSVVTSTSSGVVAEVFGKVKVPYIFAGNYNPAQAGRNESDFWYYRKGLTAPTVYDDRSVKNKFHVVSSVLYNYYDNPTSPYYDKSFSDAYANGLNQFIIRTFEYDKEKNSFYLLKVRFFNLYSRNEYATDDEFYFNFYFYNDAIYLDLPESGSQINVYTENTSLTFESNEENFGSPDYFKSGNYSFSFSVDKDNNNDSLLFVSRNSESSGDEIGFAFNYPNSNISRPYSSYIKEKVYFTKNTSLFNMGNIKLAFTQKIDSDTPNSFSLNDSFYSDLISATGSVYGYWKYTENIDINQTGAFIPFPYFNSLTYTPSNDTGLGYWFFTRYVSDLSRKVNNKNEFFLQDTYSRFFQIKSVPFFIGECIYIDLTNTPKTIFNVFMLKISDYVLVYYHLEGEEKGLNSDVYLYFDTDKYLNPFKYFSKEDWLSTGQVPYNINYIDRSKCSHGSLWFPFTIWYKHLHNYTEPLTGVGENNVLTIIDLDQTEWGKIHQPDIQRGD